MGERARRGFSAPRNRAPSPLADAPFESPEVSRVFFGADFISVTKGEGDWKHSSPTILGAIMEHFTRGLPISKAAADEREDEDFFDAADPKSSLRSRN